MSTKKDTITLNTVKGNTVRSININKRKYYFVSDLTKIYGRGFVSKLPNATLLRRVNDGVTNQERRLVNVTEFKDTLRTTKANISVSPTTTKLTAALSQQVVMDFTSKPVEIEEKRSPAEDLKNIQIDLSDVRTVEDVQQSSIKGQINALVYNYIHTKAINEGWTDEELEHNDRQKYREVYAALYKEFDRVISAQLHVKGKNLEDYGLGVESHGHRQNYLTRVGKQGLLPQLLDVAKQMFGYKLAKKETK